MNRWILLLALVFGLPTAAQADAQARKVFDGYQDRLYQIRVIENTTGEKVGIGSGFQISDNGYVASNYHVIAEYAQHSDKYKLEYLDFEGETGSLSLNRVDIINDLAIMTLPEGVSSNFFNIADSIPVKGETLYSLGNPHDLGMIVVPGVYNGIKDDSFNPRIHFTGAINSGMSGGPVLNTSGEIVGVNVATAGNQIGFLIPHGKLAELFEKVKQDKGAKLNWQIARQLQQNQHRLIDAVLSAPWETKSIGNALVPSFDAPFIRCWGNSNAKDESAYYRAFESSCFLEERLFIAPDLTSGTFDVSFFWIESDKLNPHRFASLLESILENSLGTSNKSSKKHVGNFSCKDGFVQSKGSNMRNKTALCTRAYKAYPNVFDVMFVGTSTERDEQALISNFYLSGISKADALKFTERFMGAMSWK